MAQLVSHVLPTMEWLKYQVHDVGGEFVYALDTEADSDDSIMFEIQNDTDLTDRKTMTSPTKWTKSGPHVSVDPRKTSAPLQAAAAVPAARNDQSELETQSSPDESAWGM